ncbi:MAG: glycosyltransferase family 2 protein [Planctomycetota bacterium]
MPPTSSQAVSLTVLVPAYEAAAFLRDSLEKLRAFLIESGRSAELLVIDDGSRDATHDVLEAFARDHDWTGRLQFRFARNAQNRGKGFSVRRGWLLARGENIVFTDADLTYPVENLRGVLEALEGGADVVYGSRMHAESRYVVAPSFFGKLFTRHFMGRVFNWLARLIVLPGVLDSQAGLKGLRKSAARDLAGRIRLDRFSFDVELLFVARRRGFSLRDCPVLFLYRKEPSTVRFVRDSLGMLRDMMLVRWRGFRGVYDRDVPGRVLDEIERGGAPAEASP